MASTLLFPKARLQKEKYVSSSFRRKRSLASFFSATWRHRPLFFPGFHSLTSLPSPRVKKPWRILLESPHHRISPPPARLLLFFANHREHRPNASAFFPSSETSGVVLAIIFFHAEAFEEVAFFVVPSAGSAPSQSTWRCFSFGKKCGGAFFLAIAAQSCFPFVEETSVASFFHRPPSEPRSSNVFSEANRSAASSLEGPFSLFSFFS